MMSPTLSYSPEQNLFQKWSSTEYHITKNGQSRNLFWILLKRPNLIYITVSSFLRFFDFSDSGSKMVLRFYETDTEFTFDDPFCLLNSLKIYTLKLQLQSSSKFEEIGFTLIHRHESNKTSYILSRTFFTFFSAYNMFHFKCIFA